MKNIASQLKMFAMTCLIATTLAACVKDTTPAASTTTINGQAIAGAVDGTVTVRNAAGTQLATATVSNGAFTVTLNDSDLGQELDFEVTGSYRDEVSGQTVTLTTANPLALRIAANHFVAGQAGNAPVTPGSTVVREMVKAQLMTLTQAQTAFQNAFGYTPDLTAKPFDPYATTTINVAATANNEAAFRAGMFSQLGSDLGLSAADLAELPAKLAADLADGTLDGVATGNPVTFTSGVNLQTKHQLQPIGITFSIATAKFAMSAGNQAGLTAPTMNLPPIIADAPGTTKTITLADGITQIDVNVDVYAVAPFQMGFRDVKTTHKITLTYTGTATPVDITNDVNVNGLTVTPWMYMFKGMQHGSEMGTINKAQAASGIYYVDVYYRMATGMMMMGMTVPMGQWTLKVAVAETAGGTASRTFFPKVMMNSMNGNTDLLLGTVSNSAVTWNKMGSIVPRQHRVYLKDATPAAGNHDITVFIATQTMAMMKPSFPAVRTGLANPAISSVAVDLYSVALDVYGNVDPYSRTWLSTMTEGVTVDTYGQYTATAVTLPNPNNLEVHLTVDGYSMTDAGGNPALLSFTAP